jgi:cobalamin biosynthesis Mg chelatase CobN
MLKQGFSGQVTIALSIRRLFTNDALVDVIGSEVWQKIANTYLFDQNMFSQLDPSAAQMITNVIYQANQRGMMQLTSSQADQLSQMMGIPVKGMSTTTPTTSTGGQSASSPGAVGRSSAGVSYQSSSAGVSSQASADVSEDGDQSAGDAGKSYEVSKATPQGAEDTPWGAYTVVGIVSVLALGAVGFFLKGGKFSQ